MSPPPLDPDEYDESPEDVDVDPELDDDVVVLVKPLDDVEDDDDEWKPLEDDVDDEVERNDPDEEDVDDPERKDDPDDDEDDDERDPPEKLEPPPGLAAANAATSTIAKQTASDRR